MPKITERITETDFSSGNIKKSWLLEIDVEVNLPWIIFLRFLNKRLPRTFGNCQNLGRKGRARTLGD
jgi:hypothetical protein